MAKIDKKIKVGYLYRLSFFVLLCKEYYKGFQRVKEDIYNEPHMEAIIQKL